MQILLELLVAIFELAGAWDAALPCPSQEQAEDDLARGIGQTLSLREQDANQFERDLLSIKQRFGPL
jgi:hypothetical protein